MLRVKYYVRARVPRLRLNIVLKQVRFNQCKQGEQESVEEFIIDLAEMCKRRFERRVKLKID